MLTTKNGFSILHEHKDLSVTWENTMFIITGLLLALGGIGHMEAGGSLLAGALTSGIGCCMILVQTYNQARYQ